MDSKAKEKNQVTTKKILYKQARVLLKIAKRKAYELVGRTNISKTLHYTDSIKIRTVDGKFMVGSNAPYAKAIEIGRRAGVHVPIKPLERWCKGQLGKNEQEAKQMAYAIENIIYKNGIRGKHVMRLAVEEFQSRMSK